MPRPALRILIVEDQFLIAKQLQLIVEGAGHCVVGIAATREKACVLAQDRQPDVAFVDISLADGATGMEVASFITTQCAAHVVFTTANLRRLPQDFCGAAGVVEKPFTRSGLVSALDYLAACLRGAFGLCPKPDSLRLAPSFMERWQPPDGTSAA